MRIPTAIDLLRDIYNRLIEIEDPTAKVVTDGFTVHGTIRLSLMHEIEEMLEEEGES